MVKPGTSPVSFRRNAGTLSYLLPLLALFVLTTFAARAALQFDVFLGYDGNIPEASWFPVVCEVKNDGPTFTGVIEVASGQFNESQPRRVTVELPTGTLKRLVIPAFSTARYQSSWDVRLFDDRGHLHAEQQINVPSNKQRASGAVMVGAITRTANGVPVIRPILAKDQQVQPVVARLATAIIPDNPLVFEGMDAIYLNSEKAPDLNVTQVNALLAWLNAGGHLIVAVEQISDVNATPWLRGIVPCDLTNMISAPSHSALQQWVRSAVSNPAAARLKLPNRPRSPNAANPDSNPFADLAEDPDFEKADLQIATGTLRDGEVMAATGDNTPLFINSHVGRGRVTLLMFSPEREPFRSWKNLPVFWARLLDVPTELYTSENNYSHGGWSVDGVFGAMIESRQIRKLPVEWLLLLLIVYLVVIGPLDQYWLKRIRRPMLTWITFPCYVVLFSLLIYFIGYKLRAGETEWNELHLVDVLVHNNTAELRGRTYASIYSPVNATYKLESQQHYSTFRGEFQSSWSGGQDTERADVYQVGDNFKAEIFVPVWTSQLYVSDWWESAPLPITFSVVLDGSQWAVTVKNQLDKSFPSARLVIGGRVMDLGELPAGQIRTFKFGKEQGTSLGDFVRTFGGNFQMAVQQRGQAFGTMGGGRISDVTNSSMAVSFISHLGESQGNYEFICPPGLDLSAAAGQGNAVLLAWEPDYSPAPPIKLFSTIRGHKDTLWRMTVPIDSASLH